MLAACGPAPLLPIIPDHGGPKLTNPELVVITFADDPNRAVFESMASWLVSSDWLTTVGSEYGIGAGSILANIERTDNAPDTITDSEIQNLLLGEVGGGGISANTLYVIFFPSHTSITTMNGTSCRSYLGYHSEVVGAVHVPYAVIPTCTNLQSPPSPLQYAELTMSHEIIEAATNPLNTSNPGFYLPPSSNSAWAALGGELADLCSITPGGILDGGYMVERVWSNRIAKALSGDPCVPSIDSNPYYGVGIAPDTWRAVSPGETVTFTLTGFSFGAVSDWRTFILQAPPGGVSPGQMNNGTTSTLSIDIPPTAYSGWQSKFYVVCEGPSDEHYFPIAVYVP
jgi:hypothetical protein